MYIRNVRSGSTGERIEQRGSECDQLRTELQSSLRNMGYQSSTKFKMGSACTFYITDIRLNEEYIKEKGYNISPYTGRRGRILGWRNWVEVNNEINRVMDTQDINASVSSLGDKFKVREGSRAFTEDDWDDLAWENVGSMMRPVSRVDAWHSESGY